MTDVLMKVIAGLIIDQQLIPEPRREQLVAFAKLAAHEMRGKGVLRMNFICTHNSRRSHIAQLWAWAASEHFEVLPFDGFSGGVEVTAFNPRAVSAMRRSGFIIGKAKGRNPRYPVQLAGTGAVRHSFSKVFDDASNPDKDFIAVMVCTDAEQNCPFVPGASHRVSLSYEDPKDADDTPRADEVYNERVAEIGREMLLLFQMIKEVLDEH